METLNSLGDKILAIIDRKHTESNGKCGVTPINVSIELKVPYSSIRDELNTLYENKLIKVREGANSLLLFKK